MVAPGKQDSNEELVDITSVQEGGVPLESSPLSHDVSPVAMGSSNVVESGYDVMVMEQDKTENDPIDVAEDQVRTPVSSVPFSRDTLPSSEPYKTMQSQRQQQQPKGVIGSATSINSDYFTSHLASTSQVTYFGLNDVSGPGSNIISGDSVTPALQDDVASQGSLSQQQISTASHFSNPKPTSVPNFQSTYTSRCREEPGYPSYPDQSFKALEDQQHPPFYRPASPRPPRTRSSHLSQGSSLSPNESQDSIDLPRVASGAKTVGSTPAQSPGLFTPTLSSRRQWPVDAEEGRSNTPMLHPTHQKPPKETHKLLKDIDPVSGRKTINHYEIFQRLGSGQHGTVKQGRDLQTGEMVAIKIVRRFSKKLRLGKTGDPNDMIKKEVAILKKARHPHVVSLIEVIDDDEFGKVYLVLEFVERGEIIWRKETDKAIAAFELARSRREIEGNVDEAFERAAVAEFNEGAASRRLQKARLLAAQKRQAQDRIRTQSSRSIGQPKSDFWSLEFQPDPETEVGLENFAKAGSEKGDHLRPVESSAVAAPDATESSSQSQSPSHTPKPSAQLIDSGSAPASVPSSRPHTPAPLEGTMWGPYLDENLSDNALQAMLDEIIAGQTDWTPEEKDFRFVPCLTLSQILDAFRDTVLGLEYLHYQGIIHRDIKPANLLWTADYRVKISDFGVSYLGKPIREDDNNEEIPEADAAILDEAIELAKTVGTPAFYAPELCDPQYFDIGKHPDRPAITGQIDVWALGVTLYGMIFGRLPFFHHNEFQMYERIAREEVVIPKLRLRGVEHTDKTPSNHNKRLDDILEYEEVDDELHDLLRRLLNKHPSKRINLKEVKHHPWVLRGIGDQMSWMDETDPSLQSQGRKIEVSTQDVQDAVVGLTLVDRVKAGFQRVGSVLRGRGSRKRADSNPKQPESKPMESPISASAALEPKKAQSVLKDGRRTSLRGDEQIYSALRASRDNTEHPLAQSVAVSPELRSDVPYFDEEKPARPVSDPQASRPSFPDRNLSTADSMKTIRASALFTMDQTQSEDASPSNENFSTTKTIPDPNPGSSSSLGGLFGGAGRRFVNSMRSRERGVGRQSPSQSSRSSSVDRGVEDPHASPSLALSSAIASGHVDQPPALREEPEHSCHLPNESTAEAFERAQELNYRRRSREYQAHTRRLTASIAADVTCPPSPDDENFFAQQRPTSAATSSTGFAISSSSDQILSGESTVHSRIPSVVSGASSFSATIEEPENPLVFNPEKSISPFTLGRSSRPQPPEQQSDDALSTKRVLAPSSVEDEAGYNGEAEQDSDSEDEGLAMA